MTREPTEMEKRVAIALSVRDAAGYHGKDFCDDLRKEAEDNWSGYVGEARDAIRAMREPTDEMVRAGLNHTKEIAPATAVCGTGYWYAMIDAASPE